MSTQSNKPLVETKRAVFKDGSDLRAKLIAALFGLALKLSTAANVADAVASALWASDISIRPPYTYHVPVAHIQVGEIPSSFK